MSLDAETLDRTEDGAVETRPEAPAEPTQAHAQPRPRIPRWVLRTLLLYLGSRILVALAVLLALGIAPPAQPGNWLELWDSFWYMDIARHGYPTAVEAISPGLNYSPLAFFPLWPLTIRAVGGLLGGNLLLAGYLLNFVFGGVLAVLARRIFAEVSDARTADLGVLLFVFFPGTNVFSSLYSEPLALCLAAGTLLALMRHRWALAGVLAALAGATRPPVAVAVCAALAYAVLIAVVRRREWRALLALALAPLGLLAFAAYTWAHTGSPLAWHEAEKMFGNHLDGGWSFATTVSSALSTNGTGDPLFGLSIVVGTGTVLLLVLGFFFVRRPPPALLTIYTVVVIGLPAINSALMAKPRFLAAGFPLLLGLAAYLRGKARPELLAIALAGECALLVGLTMMHLLGRVPFP
ncbi:MAG: hypothetical protein QOJ32_1577 [Frankiaceae bacterium]|nr:hypothetical protein [Frankiaceae bacterium]